jgi:hypothetical protein
MSNSYDKFRLKKIDKRSPPTAYKKYCKQKIYSALNLTEITITKITSIMTAERSGKTAMHTGECIYNKIKTSFEIKKSKNSYDIIICGQKFDMQSLRFIVTKEASEDFLRLLKRHKANDY